MDAFEKELKRIDPAVRRLSFFALLGKKIMVKGSENIIKSGPNIIIGNHIGTFKDIAALYKILHRPIFFMANKMIFNKDELNFLIKKHLYRHLKNLAPLLNSLLKPLKSYIIDYVSTNIGKVGTIPVDIYKRGRPATVTCQDYLKKGRVIILLQGRGRVMKKSYHPYVSSFKKGASFIAYNMFKEEGIRVPVTPIAFFGTHVPLLIPAKIKINVGEPMYINDYLASEFNESVNRFREALERRVKDLFAEAFRL